MKLGEIGYPAQGRWRPLPDWAHYLMAIGEFAASEQIPARRLVVGVSLPTRAFAAAFAALGVSAATYSNPEDDDPRTHFEWLASLPSGTPIRFRRGRYLYYGRLIGAESVRGTEYLVYDADSRCSLPWDRCGAVQPLEPTEEFVRRRHLAPNAPFVEASLAGVDALAHAAHTRLDCLLVGVKDALREDIVSQEFLTRSSDGSVKAGVLNDLLRCDAFELNANDHDRTAVVSGFTDEVAERLLTEVPPCVVFDGPGGFLRLRSHWRRSPWIVLLDRSAVSVAAAADAFNQELALSADDADLSPLGEPPAGFEVRAYLEVAR